MILTKFNKNTGILDSKFVGTIVLHDIVEYIRATKNNVFYPRVLKILTDATKSDMNLVFEDLEIIVAENYKSIEQYDCIIDAIVIESPKETALSMLYQELAKTGKYKFNIFSTREAAMQWLEKY
tara:strand:- start:31739 stop:32110 length:372 start_codon:yes stop_codon:yes gene_type:complete